MNKGKYLQIFKYLFEFSKIRDKSVRDIENSGSGYIEKLWLNDIPKNDLFENILWANNFDLEKDYWLKIRKPIEPHKPKFAILPKTIQSWVEPSSLLYIKETPVLKDTIESIEGLLSINEFPDIEQDFLDYIQGQWLADIEDYQRKLKTYNEKHLEYESLNAIYTKLFRIYNKSQQFGEEYELVIGIGLLCNKASSGTVKIYGHVMIQQVHIKVKYFNEKLELLVRPNVDKLPLIETDSIIDLQPQFDQNNIIDAKRKAEELIHEKEIASIFDNHIHDALRIFAQRFCSQGDYFEQYKKPAEEGKKPKIYFSPALLLRKRNTKSLSALYENISNADDNFDIPSINDLINNDGNTINTSQNDNFSDETIYFPDKYNDEQIQIIEKARRSNKVLVQGPPGTGKSHTIANLICHLLAHGNKVLVTAYTQRALEVLKDKLPEDFQNLTVNLLGGDASSIQGLDKSVNTISREASQADLPVRKHEIEELEQKLSEVREQKAFNINELIKIKVTSQ